MVRYFMTVFYTFIFYDQIVTNGTPELFVIIVVLTGIAVYQQIKEDRGKLK